MSKSNVQTGDGLRQPRDQFISQKTVGKKAKFPKTAHFPGTGPKGKCCITCEHYVSREGKGNVKVCDKWAQLMNVSIYEAASVDPHTAACKYYEANKPFAPDDA